MNHVDDIAKKIRDSLNADPAVYRVTLVEGSSRTDGDGYPRRDGEWLLYVAMRDGRYFSVQVNTDDVFRERALLLEADEHAEPVVRPASEIETRERQIKIRQDVERGSRP